MPFGPKLLKPITDDLSTLKPIPGCDGYFINRNGDVFCVRKMQQHRCRDGYTRVAIRMAGRCYRKAVHSLLALTFLPSPKFGQTEVRHLDGNKENNSLNNLAWGTRAENANDMAMHGTVKGEKNARAILTEEQVRQIKFAKPYRGYLRELSEKHGVSRGAIKQVRCGRNWKHVA